MSVFSFTTENIIALNKLEMSVRRVSGLRHNLSEERSLLDLITHASVSKSVQVEAAFFEFIQSLNADQKSQLVYRGISFERPSPLDAIENQQPAKKVRYAEKTYRGVTKVTRVASVEPESDEEPTKKPQRIYRGRVVS